LIHNEIMNIALIGYGKMGKAIEKIAEERGHSIVLICNSELSVQYADFSNVDLAIEFSQPKLAVKHINFCLENKIPLVVGTTGWNKHLTAVREKVGKEQGSLLYASNFSIGVNVFFELNKKLAQLISGKKDYVASIEEVHHLQKLDAPSGTAITLADEILQENDYYISWVLGKGEIPHTNPNQLALISYRSPDVPGTHTVKYTSNIDNISISHQAHNRMGFAVGAVIAAEWLLGKRGIYQMKDVLNF
jgi:4-hydroxy-tetrahydrodipicolinate reductase